MEIQKATMAQDSSLGLKVIDAIQHPLKIIKAQDQDLVNALGYCFAVLGFREEHFPVGLSRSFLIQFIRENYKFFSVEEIKTAFLMLVKGDYGDKAPKHYNNFSPEYFGSVMACYKTHREKAQLELSLASNQKKPEEAMYEPNSIEKIKIQQEFDTVVISPIFEKFKRYGILDLGTIPAKMVFNSLVGYHKIISFTREEKEQIKGYAQSAIESRREKLKNGNAVNYQDHKKKLEILSDLMKAEFVENEVKNECFKICIVQCFNQMVETNFKF